MTNTQLRALRGTVSAVAVFAAAAVLAGCTSPGAIPRTSLAGQPVAADQPSPVDANPAGNPTPATTPSPPPVHPSHPSSHPSSSSSGSHRPAPSPTVVVSAVDSSYTGLCPPPTDATEFKAVITVRSGPTTVTFRWTTSNGGDSDPSTQTITFPGNGHQSRTVYHNEHFYPPAPYPAHITDWVAVDLMTPVQTQSNHVGIAINCVPLTAAIKRTSDDYKGPCPPPAGATGFDLYINSTVDTNATISWRLSNNGDSGPNPDLNVHLAVGMNVFHHQENVYPPAPYPASHSDYVIATVTTAGYSVTATRVNFTTYCTL